MIIDRKTFFTLKLAKSIANIQNEKERMEALSSVQDGSKELVTATVNAILASKKAS